MRVSSRDTCICVTPIFSATSCWVSPSKKRSLRIEAITLAESAHGWVQHQPGLGGALVVVVAGEQLLRVVPIGRANREIK